MRYSRYSRYVNTSLPLQCGRRVGRPLSLLSRTADATDAVGVSRRLSVVTTRTAFRHSRRSAGDAWAESFLQEAGLDAGLVTKL